MKQVILTVDGDVLDIHEASDLEAALAALPKLGEDECTEIHLGTYGDGEDGPFLTALIHGARGWLMYMREAGGAGCSTRNPAYEGDPDAMIEYTLSNGQVDEYPASWAYPTQALMVAFIEFHRTGEPPSGFQWFDDGG